jgi:hypothetical protein
MVCIRSIALSEDKQGTAEHNNARVAYISYDVAYLGTYEPRLYTQ